MTETDVITEIIDIFGELSPESQQTLLMYIRVAHMAENSVKKSIKRAIASGKETSEAEF